ncbi:MAG: oligosaccharide flippase family protein [Candidatus Binataceae bacterium]
MAARSFGWAGAARALTAIGNVGRYAFFARLLTPYDFGVTTMALLTLDMLFAFTNTSFDRSLIQQQEEIEPFLDTVWVTTVVRGVVLAIVLIAGARVFAGLFRQSEASIVFCAVAPMALLRGVQSPAAVSMFRRFDFRIALVLNAAELIGGLAIGTPGILYWGDWRGLVAAVLGGQACRTGLTHWYFPYRPHMRFDRARFTQMFAFGRWNTGTSLAEFAAQQIDNFVVAHVLGPQAVGDYQTAFRVGEMPVSELAFSASLVTFPMASRLSGRKDARQRLFFYTTGAVVVAGVLYAVVVLKAGHEIIRVILGAQWLGSLAPARWLCFYGLFQGLLILGRSFLDGIGTPASSFNMTMVRVAVLGAAIYPLTHRYGTSGAAAAALLSVIAPVPLMLMLYRKAEAR